MTESHPMTSVIITSYTLERKPGLCALIESLESQTYPYFEIILVLEKSKKLLLKEYLEEGHVHENYNADIGDGDDSRFSDCFYSWGGLLGFMSLIEAGYFKI